MLYLSSVQLLTYHFMWADQREKQGYKSDVPGLQLIVPNKL